MNNVKNKVLIIQRGISDEALEVLSEVFEADLDMFQFTDANGNPVNKSVELMNAEALKKDGQLSVIRWIKQHKKIKVQ